jgi:hypothetical protein
MAEIIHSNKVCGISDNTRIPVMDDKYFQKYSAYEKCKCINKLKSSLEILAKNKGYGYNTYVNDYKNRYDQNKCDDVFKNYKETNLKDTYDSTTQADKLRIETQSIKERNQRVYFAGAIFIVVVGMITIYSTRKS